MPSMKERYRGLKASEVSQLVKQYGYNTLPEQKSDLLLLIFFRQFKSFLVVLLFFAALISLLLREMLDALFILLIIGLNGFIGFFQEIKAKNEMASLKKMIVATTRVIRDGKEIKLETKYLLPNDLVVLESGDKIPADGKIITGKNILVNEASLTGESVPIEKNSGEQLFMSTTLLTGRAEMVVTAIGSSTAFGKLAVSLTQIPEEKTPLEIKISDFSRKLGFFLILIIAIVFLIGIGQQRDLPTLFFSSIALAVAAIPEGLPTVLTITLAIGVRRLARRGAIVKRLVVTESLGTVDVICTDKTGTLTKNEMTVKKLITGKKNDFEVTGVGFNSQGEIRPPGGKQTENDPDLRKILEISALCNTSSLAVIEGEEEYNVLGDTTEGALLILSRKGGVNYEALREEKNIKEEIPFDSTRRLMTVVVDGEIFCKGAPDKILEICHLTDDDKKYFQEWLQKEGSKGYRILGFACKKYESYYSLPQLEKDLNFVGFVMISDPPREEVQKSIEICKKAGVEVVMVTGDSPETARSVAQQIGLLRPGDELITGEQLHLYSDEVLGNNLPRIKVFARVTPEDKLRIVEAFQKEGKTVAVTGDGVNDAPALKKAQVGVAMGITGTDVSKEAADLIITDDNFSTIVSAIEEGRAIYLNLVKAIKYLLSCNLAEVTLVFLAMIGGFPLPLSPLAILWLNIVTDGLPAVALAFDKSDSRILASSYQKLGIENNLLSRKNFQQLSLIGLAIGIVSLFLFIKILPWGIGPTRLTVFTFLVIVELLVAFLVRGQRQKIFGNKFLLVVTFFSILIQLFIILLPGVRERFI
ncbi:cation-translocating P-type ATPase [Candidatus Microgenomates bacterium]|nr:cation-translocating P-type ATPase [Candidatus Microgenomates bacterium]